MSILILTVEPITNTFVKMGGKYLFMDEIHRFNFLKSVKK